jgi:hypothetical protein
MHPAVQHFAKSLQLRGFAQIVVHSRIEAFSALIFCHVRSKRDYHGVPGGMIPSFLRDSKGREI